VTFSKRKQSLIKKASELSILCDCQIGIIIFSEANKLFEYASNDIDDLMLRYVAHGNPVFSKTNADLGKQKDNMRIIKQ
jgi:hypothetical protein